jgi:hypothetical protein
MAFTHTFTGVVLCHILIDKALDGNPAGGLLNADNWRSAARASPLHREEKDMAQSTGV